MCKQIDISMNKWISQYKHIHRISATANLNGSPERHAGAHRTDTGQTIVKTKEH
jgi:hypothetical protein